MINNCPSLNIALGTCAPTGTSCRYMSDPHSCPNYGEETEHPWAYKTHPDWVDKLGQKTEPEVESIDEFMARSDSEFKKISGTPDKSIRPTRPCINCGLTQWWEVAKGEWICGRCHPNPNPVKKAPDWF